MGCSSAFLRSGQQEGVGRVTLGDPPRMMGHHDRSHALEMADLLAEIAPGHPRLGELRAFGSAWPGTAAGR